MGSGREMARAAHSLIPPYRPWDYSSRICYSYACQRKAQRLKYCHYHTKKLHISPDISVNKTTGRQPSLLPASQLTPKISCPVHNFSWSNSAQPNSVNIFIWWAFLYFPQGELIFLDNNPSKASSAFSSHVCTLHRRAVIHHLACQSLMQPKEVNINSRAKMGGPEGKRIKDLWCPCTRTPEWSWDRCFINFWAQLCIKKTKICLGRVLLPLEDLCIHSVCCAQHDLRENVLNYLRGKPFTNEGLWSLL